NILPANNADICSKTSRFIPISQSKGFHSITSIGILMKIYLLKRDAPAFLAQIKRIWRNGK
ncbi:MAG: hypothetical protein QGH94_13710, partial [Phycisphaerae bacterium]|nr:hypothetical protein [Phycisphaerae bacterium]